MDIRNLVKVASVGANDDTIITVLNKFPRVSVVHKVQVDRKAKTHDMNGSGLIAYSTSIRGGKESDRATVQELIDQNRETYDRFVDDFARIYFL